MINIEKSILKGFNSFTNLFNKSNSSKKKISKTQKLTTKIINNLSNDLKKVDSDINKIHLADFRDRFQQISESYSNAKAASQCSINVFGRIISFQRPFRKPQSQLDTAYKELETDFNEFESSLVIQNIQSHLDKSHEILHKNSLNKNISDRAKNYMNAKMGHLKDLPLLRSKEYLARKEKLGDPGFVKEKSFTDAIAVDFTRNCKNMKMTLVSTDKNSKKTLSEIDGQKIYQNKKEEVRGRLETVIKDEDLLNKWAANEAEVLTTQEIIAQVADALGVPSENEVVQHINNFKTPSYSKKNEPKSAFKTSMRTLKEPLNASTKKLQETKRIMSFIQGCGGQQGYTQNAMLLRGGPSLNPYESPTQAISDLNATPLPKYLHEGKKEVTTSIKPDRASMKFNFTFDTEKYSYTQEVVSEMRYESSGLTQQEKSSSGRQSPLATAPLTMTNTFNTEGKCTNATFTLGDLKSHPENINPSLLDPDLSNTNELFGQ